MRRITVELGDAFYDALAVLAKADRRSVRAYTAIMLENMLRETGAIARQTPIMHSSSSVQSNKYGASRELPVGLKFDDDDSNYIKD